MSVEAILVDSVVTAFTGMPFEVALAASDARMGELPGEFF